MSRSTRSDASSAAATRDDLAHPRLGQPFHALNAVAGPLSRQLLSLHPDALVVAAIKQTGLSDLGTEAISEPLGILCRALQETADLHALGRVAARTQLVGLLGTRGKVLQLTAAHPEIEAAPVASPIVIMGMPRTGTTFLQRLLSRDPGLRHLPYWEALAPLPAKRWDRRDAPSADRVKSAARSVKVLDRAAPGMAAIHEVDPFEADEEIWLLAVHLASMIFECTWHVPAFAEWYDAADLGDGYGWLKRLLQVLQWYRPADRWLLKSPQHLEQLPAFLEHFPDAVIVQTHRDPLQVVTSTASMITYGRRMSTRHVDPSTIGRYWAWRVERMLSRNMAQRDALGPRVVDVHFDRLTADPMGVVEEIYTVAGRPLTDQARGAMEHYRHARPKGHHGAHRYEPSDFDIDPAAVRRDFADYVERFGVTLER